MEYVQYQLLPAREWVREFIQKHLESSIQQWGPAHFSAMKDFLGEILE